MSYTIVKDDEFYSRQLENRLNAVVRRCRIGRTFPKMVLHGGPRVTLREYPTIAPKDTFFVPPPITDISWLNNIVVGSTTRAGNA